MVRNYKRKSERGGYGDDALKEALSALQNQSMKAVRLLITMFCLKMHLGAGMWPEPRWIDYPAPSSVSEWPDQ